jgi:serine/threonine protein kinase
MNMTPGTKLGPYEIQTLLGKGGMGEVYRARDTKLKREVALKVLPEEFARDPGRMVRFQREAEVLASLNHPNIAHIYGVEESALAMELVEGETLAGPLPIDTALNYAKQIAEALEYAHERGVIHRDLKPANIKITPDGAVKLLDFGLAKAAEEGATPADASNSPTLTLGATSVGVILGTAAYMSPEQASGKIADRRSDIWSFGAVLYEMLSGKQTFAGESVSDTLASVLKVDPDWRALPQNTPASIVKLMRRCLTRDRKQRLQAIGEARIVLENPAAEDPAPVATAPSRPQFGWVILALFAVISVAFGFVAWKHVREEPPRIAKLFFPLPEKETVSGGSPPATAVSPDGQRIAYEALVDGKGELWVRELGNSEPRKLAEGSSGMPFWAPDSRRLGFFAEGKLKKIDVTGGPAVTIADAQATTGGRGPWCGSWNQDDIIVFGRITSPLFRVSAAGGSPTILTDLDASRHETAHFAPWFLPDGHHFLYVALSSDAEKTGLYVTDLAAKTRKLVMIGNARTTYVAPGYLLFVRDGTLLAQPFDVGKLETTGDAVPVAEQVDVFNAGVGLTMGYFAASQNGVLVYTSGRALGSVQLTWFSRTGRKLDTVSTPGQVVGFSLSPDGTRVALVRRDPQVGRSDLWIRDLARGVESRMTSSAIGGGPVWSADGTHIFFASRPFDKVYQKAANNTGAEEVVDSGAKLPMDASRDGRYLVMTTAGNIPRTTGLDIWVLPLFGDRKPFPYLETEFQDDQPRLSPDGRWLAYRSNESKRSEIYVVSFPQPGGKWHISTTGGREPVWNHDGRELYYYSLDNKIMAVDIKPSVPESPQLQFGVPRALFEVRIFTIDNPSFDVSKDGRFLLPILVEQEVSTPMTVVLNWPQLLKR